MDKRDLLREFTHRNSYKNFSKALLSLPDPDPILLRTGKHIEAYRDLTSDSHL